MTLWSTAPTALQQPSVWLGGVGIRFAVSPLGPSLVHLPFAFLEADDVQPV
jgi:hypothetical protein